MVKIIYVVTKGRWGGAQRYVYDLATRLPKKRFAPLVVTGAGRQLARKLMVSGVACRQLARLGRDLKFFDDLAAGWELYRLFKTERPNTIHLNSSKIGLIGALAGRVYNLTAKSYKLKAKIIFTAHGWAFNEDRTWLARTSLKILHWLTIALCHQTIVVAWITARQTRHWPFIKNKITVIHNGLGAVNFEARQTARESLLGKTANDRQGLWLGTISELHKNKGLPYLLLALANLNLRTVLGRNQGQSLGSLTLVIIGEGEERKNLEKQIAELGLQNTVFLIGHKDNAAALLPAFDIFTLTSITEAFPYVLLEAGQAGLPVIASGVGGIPEIIKSMESGILVKPRAPSEIAKAIEFLIEQPEKRRKFGSKLRQKIRRDLSTARMVKQTLKIYNETNEATS